MSTPSGPAHPNWKGQSASYWAIHIWVNSHYTKQGVCTLCRTPGITDWANLSGLYLRLDRSDWVELCKVCHNRMDSLATLDQRKTLLHDLQKPCQTCGTVMTMPKDYSYDMWDRKKFCSLPCRDAGYVRVKRQTHCKRNHEFTPENTYIDPKGGQQCRICARDRTRKYRAASRIV